MQKTPQNIQSTYWVRAWRPRDARIADIFTSTAHTNTYTRVTKTTTDRCGETARAHACTNTREKRHKHTHTRGAIFPPRSGCCRLRQRMSTESHDADAESRWVRATRSRTKDPAWAETRVCAPAAKRLAERRDMKCASARCERMSLTPRDVTTPCSECFFAVAAVVCVCFGAACVRCAWVCGYVSRHNFRNTVSVYIPISSGGSNYSRRAPRCIVYYTDRNGVSESENWRTPRLGHAITPAWWTLTHKVSCALVAGRTQNEHNDGGVAATATRTGAAFVRRCACMHVNVRRRRPIAMNSNIRQSGEHWWDERTIAARCTAPR